MTSWRLPVFAIVSVIGFIGFLCPACGRDGNARAPRPSDPLLDTTVRSTAVKTVEFEVAGMTCGGCAAATEVALERMDGVHAAEASYDEKTGSGRAVVEYDPERISPDRMIAAVEAIGFRPTIHHRPNGGT